MKALDEVFGLLSRQRRRYVLYYLEEADGPVSVEELAAQVADWEHNGNEAPDDLSEEVTLTLVHHHLPRAAEARFVEYDREAGVVQLTGTPSEFGVVLSVSRAIEQPDEEDGVVRLIDLV